MSKQAALLQALDRLQIVRGFFDGANIKPPAIDACIALIKAALAESTEVPTPWFRGGHDDVEGAPAHGLYDANGELIIPLPSPLSSRQESAVRHIVMSA